jgi:hypothetical protein
MNSTEMELARMRDSLLSPQGLFAKVQEAFLAGEAGADSSRVMSGGKPLEELPLWRFADWEGRAGAKSEARALYKKQVGAIPRGAVFTRAEQ